MEGSPSLVAGILIRMLGRSTIFHNSIARTFGVAPVGEIVYDWLKADLAKFTDAEKDKAVTATVDKALAAVKAADEASSQIRIEEFGDASSNSGFEKLVQNDLKRLAAYSTLSHVSVIVLGIWYFRRMEHSFADVM